MNGYNKVNIFSFVLGGSISGVLLLPIGRLGMLFKDSDHGLCSIGVVLFSMSIASFLLSSIFTVLVYKVRSFERPRDPKLAVSSTVSMKTEEDVLSSIIADFAVATERNHEINNKKARHLSMALLGLLNGLLFLGLGLLAADLLNVLKGGA